MTSPSHSAFERNDDTAEARADTGHRLGRFWRRKTVRFTIYIVTISTAVWFTATSSEPWVPSLPAPNAEEAGAARAAFWQLRGGGSVRDGGTPVALTGAQMAGISALATHGLRPDRLGASVRDGKLTIQASRPLVGGRWLNLRATFVGKSSGFPPFRLSVGNITLPASFGRYPFELARAALLLSGTDLAPLDKIVRAVVVEKEAVTATLKLPTKTGVIDRLAGLSSDAIDPKSVVRAYCNLAAQQRARPQQDFEVQVRRAFAFGNTPASPGRNGAALVALAMFVADERAGYLAGVKEGQIRSCRIPLPGVILYGRTDLPKHWALSAAISAAQGTQLARAIGEWKELADSLSPRSEFALGDPSGFSFVDVAADRAGLRAAMAAMSGPTASVAAQRLAEATADQLLPRSLLEKPDGLTSAEFERHFGGLDAARYQAAISDIDRALTERWR